MVSVIYLAGLFVTFNGFMHTLRVVNVSLGTSKLLTVIICVTISAAVTVKTLLLKKHAQRRYLLTREPM